MMNVMKNLIVLVGMMGCGKGTIGAFLSRVIGYDFIDIDKEIEKSENMSITNIFNEYGEKYFRKIEKLKTFEYINRKKMVLSLGGGGFEDEEVRNILKKYGFVIYLKATPEVLFERIKTEIHRPLLHKNFSVDSIAFILKKRQNNYEKAHITIDTTNKTKKEIVSKIERLIK